MKKIGFVSVVLLIVVLLGCQNQMNQSQQKPKDGIFIHISHGADDIHRVLMGLQMAVLMSEDKDVLVYFDIRGIDIVLKDAEDFTYSHFPSSKTQLDILLSKEIPVLACPGCLKAAGKTENDLMDGISIADKNTFFNFTTGRILTIDY
jgi:predicted peroxiredoxin